MASWSHWFWVTTSVFIIDWRMGGGVTANSLLVGPVRSDQVSLQMRNFPEVWRQARGGFPVTIPIRGHSTLQGTTLVEGKVIKSSLLEVLVKGKVIKPIDNPGLVEGKDIKSSLVNGKVIESRDTKVTKHRQEPYKGEGKVTKVDYDSSFVGGKPDHESHLEDGKLTKPVHKPSLVERKDVTPVDDPELSEDKTPRAMNDHSKPAKRLSLVVPDNATVFTRDKQMLPVTLEFIGKEEEFQGEKEVLETIKQAVEDKIAEEKYNPLINEPFGNISDNEQHKSSEDTLELEDANWSMNNTKMDDSDVSVSQSVSRVSVEVASNRTIRPRHYKHKFSSMESRSDSLVSSAETRGSMQQIGQPSYNQEKYQNQVIESPIETRNMNGNDPNMDIIIAKRQFGQVDIDTDTNEKLDQETRINKEYNNATKNMKNGNQFNQTLDDVYSFDPIEMQPTEPSIKEEMNKFIRIFRKETKDLIEMHNVRSETNTKIKVTPKKAIENSTKKQEGQVNTPATGKKISPDNATSDREFWGDNLAKLKSLAHVTTGRLGKNSQTKVSPSGEDTGLNSSRAGKAINRRPVLIQVKPEDISIIFSKTFLQQRTSPYQTKDLKDQKVSSRELSKVKEHITAKTAIIEEKHPQKDTLITHNQQDKYLTNRLIKTENASFENLGLRNRAEENRRNHLKTIIENNESSAPNASTHKKDENQINVFIRSTILPSLNFRTTYPPLQTSLTQLKANMRKSSQDDNIYHQHSIGDDIYHPDTIGVEEESRSDLPIEGPDTLAMTRKDQDIETYQDGNNSEEINTNFDQDNTEDLMSSASFVDFVSPPDRQDNQSMERTHGHIRIEVEGRAVTAKFLDVTNIVAVALGTVVFIIIVTVISALVLYRRSFLLKPHSLDECYTNSESGSSCWTEQDIFQTVSYEDCQGIDLPRDNSEEMFNLDNDSFLNSLEAMTIPDYWNDSVRHTKL